MKQKLIKKVILAMVAVSSCCVAQSFVGSNQALALELKNYWGKTADYFLYHKYSYYYDRNGKCHWGLSEIVSNAEKIGFMYQYEFSKLYSRLEKKFEKLKEKYSKLIDDDLSRLIEDTHDKGFLCRNGTIPLKNEITDDPGHYYEIFIKSHNNEKDFSDYGKLVEVSKFKTFLEDAGVYYYYGKENSKDYEIGKDPISKLFLGKEAKYDDYRRSLDEYEDYMSRMMEYRFNLLRIFSVVNVKNLLKDENLHLLKDEKGEPNEKIFGVSGEDHHTEYREVGLNVIHSMSNLSKIYRFVEDQLEAGGFLRSV